MTIRPLYPDSRPSLDLNFAKTKRLDPRISFSRASTGTYFGNDGLLKSAAVNEARFDHNPSTGESLGLLVEEARTNSVTYSNFQFGWTAQELTAVPNADIAPDGTLTATKLIPTTATDWHFIQKSSSLTSSQRCISVFVKAVEISEVFVGIYPYVGQGGVFNLANGTTSSTGATITPHLNGWYRVSYQVSYPGRYTLVIHPGTRTNTVAGNGVDGIYVWGAQYEDGATFPTSYIPTPATFTGRASTATYYDASGVIQTAGSGVARDNAYFPDENGVFRSAGLLLEAAGTNLLLRSEEFNDGAWSKSTWTGITVTANALAAPDGNVTADRAVSAGGTGIIWQSCTATSGTTYTFSIWVRPASSGNITLYMNQEFNVGIASQTFAVQAGTWNRLSITGTVSSGTVVIPHVSDIGDVYLWGAQLEASPYPTSYIPTTTSTVTRAADTSTSATVTRSADVASITGSNFSSWYNENQGTLLAYQRSSATQDAYPTSTFILSSSDPNAKFIGMDVTNDYNRFYVYGNGSTAINSNYAPVTPGTLTRNALAYASNNVAAVRNGGTVATDTDVGIPIAEIDRATIGHNLIYGYQKSQHLARFTYWPTRLSDATLQAITR